MTTAIVPGAVVVPDVSVYRAAARAPLSLPGSAQASPLHPFVLSTAAFDAVVAGDGTPVHLSQEVHVTRLVRTGEQVRIALDVVAARREPRGVRLALRTELTGEAGDPIARLETAVLLVGATGPEPFGDVPAAATAAADRAAAPVTVTRTLTRDTVRAYADASGDHNPIHLDDAAGAAAGFPGVIAHGMSVLALVCEEVTDAFAGGDAARIAGIGCRFTSPVLPGEPLAVVLQPGAEAGTVTFTCRTPTGIALKGGWVRVRPGGDDG
ncbi:MaoC family dehydratase [Spirilliplanes yamanashiensis]|uniref:MaoC-like domain-containing protein n=1 Tax=Spirilliplanes yamanashiensis TaxID=42233 RepID=A0A8J3Y5I1_9ACTN|nr:MaoC family dehydratase [Spirilliplanes yamanashiensis]MDP9819313.1 acyl dehydratase [Spirilliplanes yamanashiensis]GIJ01864.1 hypothetical protein Sya03_12160 [Spirilliplanes yamanashiensis]